MRWGIFADIHANYQAWAAVVARLLQERIDRYVCLGDLVGYGARPVETIAEVLKLNPLMIAGNHDWAAVGLFDSGLFNPYAQQAVVWTASKITLENKAMLRKLPLTGEEQDLTFVHGSLDHPEQFGYIFDLNSAAENFALLTTRICFIGHTHVPVTFIAEGKNYSFSDQDKIKLSTKRRYIVNAGSVGQPRDGNWQAGFIIYDSAKDEIVFKRVAYDVQQAQEEIIRAGLPRILAERLAVGR